MVVALSATLAAPGCSTPAKRSVASTEPGLSTLPGDSGVVVADRARPVPAGDTIVDRHPLLSKPRQYYENSGNNKVTKTAAAAVLGVPAGLYGELKQIVVGTPKTSSSTY